MYNEQFSFDGVPSSNFQAYVFGHGVHNDPEADYKVMEIPGKNGSLHFFNGRYKNVSVEYPVIIKADDRFKLRELVYSFRSFLASKTTYCRLEDSHSPEHYMLGIYKGDTETKITGNGLMTSFTVKFDCKPQRFLKSGDMPITITASGAVYNPTQYDAKPLIRCNGQSGSITVNGVRVSVTGCSSYVDLDCDIMEAYEGSTSRNGTTTLTDGVFPVLSPGRNEISFSGFSSIVITPRFWTL